MVSAIIPAKQTFGAQRGKYIVLTGCISLFEGLVVTYCASSLVFNTQICFPLSPFPLLFCLTWFLYSLLFCIKMKSETQNIYNFCMDRKKRKNVKAKNIFIVLAMKRCQETSSLVISSFVANVFTTAAKEWTINSFWIRWQTGPVRLRASFSVPPLLFCVHTGTVELSMHNNIMWQGELLQICSPLLY